MDHRTTLDKAREKSHEELVAKLQGLLEKNYDAEHGYKEALLRAENGHLKSYLKDRAAMRANFATQISDLVLKLNETPIASGSSAGAMHRTWISIKDALSSNSDKGILTECVRGEKASIEEYQQAMDDYPFPTAMASILTEHMLQIEKSIEEIKRIEDLF